MRQFQRAYVADSRHRNKAPGNDGAAAYEDSRDLSQGCQHGNGGAYGCSEGLRQGAGKGEAGEAGAVQSGKGSHHHLDGGDQVFVQRRVGGQPQGPVVHDAVSGHVSHDGGDPFSSQKEKGADGNDRGKDADGEEKAVRKVAGDFFQGLGGGGDNCPQAHEKHCGSGHDAGGVAAPQVKHQHGGDIRQEGQGSGYGQDQGRSGGWFGRVMGRRWLQAFFGRGAAVVCCGICAVIGDVRGRFQGGSHAGTMGG